MTKIFADKLRRVLVAASLQRPMTMVLAAGFLAAVSLILAATRLEFHTNRADLISSGDRYQQLVERDRQEFEELPERVVVVIRSDNPETAKAFATALGQRWEMDPKIEKVLYRINIQGLQDKGLLYLSAEDLIQLRQKLETHGNDLRELAAAPTLQALFTFIDRELTTGLVNHLFTDGLVEDEPEEAALDFTPLLSMLRQMNDGLAGGRTFRSPWDAWFVPGREGASHDGFLRSDDKRFLFVLANPRREAGEFNRFEQAVQQIREDVRELQRAFPDTEVGVTGRAVLEADELAQAKRDMTLATLISLAGVTFLFVIFFRGLVRPVLATVTLVVGLSWLLGFATLTIGHLNILTIALLPMLVGLGIDYSIHFIARYEEEKTVGQPLSSALERTVAGSGPAILAAALTTALGFFALVLSGFKGLVELGLLSGIGILLLALASFTTLPALLILAERRQGVGLSAAVGRSSNADRGYLPSASRHPWATLAASAILVGVSVPALFRVGLDSNLLRLQNDRAESVIWAQRMFESSRRSVLTEEITAGTLEEVRRKAAALEALPSVASVESIVSVIPEDQPRKLQLLKAMRPLLADLSFPKGAAEALDLEALRAVLGRIRFKMGEAADAEANPGNERFAHERREVRRLVDDFTGAVSRMSPMDARGALVAFQDELAEDLQAKVGLLGKQLTAGPVGQEDLPPELQARYLGKTGHYRLFVSPAENVWEFDVLSRFVKDVRSVDPDARGTPVMTYEYLRMMTEGYQRAALYSVLGVAALSLLTFRAVHLTLLALLPLAVGGAWTLGLMGFLGISFNVANLLFLPLIVGIGIDNGIYVVQRFQEARPAGRTSSPLPRSTGMAITLSSLTTIVGFGSLMISGHRGISSLGLVVVLGVGSVFLASVTTLPSLLALLSRRGGARPRVAVVPGRHPVRRPAVVPAHALAPAPTHRGHGLARPPVGPGSTERPGGVNGS